MIFNAYSATTDGLFEISIKSSGHIFAQNGRRISRPLGRDDWLLFYVAKGTERFELDKITYAEDGSFILFKPHERQEHVCITEKTAEFYYVHFNAPNDFSPFDFESSRVYSAKPISRVRDLFEEMIGELQTRQSCYEKICVLKLLEILCLLSRRYTSASNPNERYTSRINHIIQQMNREYSEDLTLEDYAKRLHMSKFHFLRIFKAITGESPVEYRNNIRIEHAKELLEDRSIPIGEVGAQVGYKSNSYFCDAFKRKVGCSPAKYRQNLTKIAPSDNSGDGMPAENKQIANET